MADINKAIVYVLRNEDRKLSGVVTTDRGGTTRFGVAQKSHPNIDPTFYTCPVVDALAMAQKIYATEYAAPLHLGDIISQPTANKLLDIAINCGVGIAAKMAQTAVTTLGTPVAIDEHLGPASVAALNKVDPDKLMGQLIILSQQYYRDVAVRDHASANEIASWLTRAGKPGI